MKDTLFYATAQILERLVSFLLLPILTKIITPAEYAIWSQSIVISGVMIPVVLLGFQTAVIKFFPLWDGQEKVQKSVLLWMLVTVFALLSAIAIAAILFDRSIATLIFGQPDFSFYIPLLVGLLFSEALFEFLVGILRATSRIRRVSLYLLLKGVWRIGILILVLIGMHDGFYDAFWSFVLFQLIVTMLIYMKEVELVALFRSGISIGRHHWNEVLRFSLPLVPLAVLTATNNFVDRLFLIRFHGLEMVATYSAAFSFAAIAAFFYSVLGFTLFPVLSRYWAIEDMERVVTLMREVLIVYLSILLPFIVFMAVIGDDVLLLLTNKNYTVHFHILLLLSCNVGLLGFYQIAFYLFLLKRGSSQAPFLMGVAVGVNVMFNALLVPEYGMTGAALAGFASNSLLAGMFIYLSQQALPWGFPWKESIRIAVRALLMGTVIWFAVRWLRSDSSVVLFMILVVAAFVYGLMDYFDKQSSFFTVIRSH